MIAVLVATACSQSKLVPESRHMIKKNKIIYKGDKLDKDELASIIRQPTNSKRFFIKWKLLAYNSIDSAKVAEKRIRIDQRIRSKNRERLIEQNETNQKRIERAREKGDSTYNHKIKSMKDTVNPRSFIREWLKYKMGEPPVLFDSAAFNKTISQMDAYLKKKGYFYGKSEGMVDYKDNKKCNVTYAVTTGPQYTIKSTKIDCKNQSVRNTYQEYVRTLHDPPLIGSPFDSDLLDNYRYKVAKFMRDSAYYGFSTSHITYVADTSRKDMSVELTLVFADRTIRPDPAKDSLVSIAHKKYVIEEVYFHVADTAMFEGNFVRYMDSMGLKLFNGPFINTIDTMYYSRGSDEKDGGCRDAIFYYNADVFVKPRVLEMQNFLEQGSNYTEKNASNSYDALLRMNLFKAIKTDLVEIPESNRLEVHYYIAPNKRQSYSFQPRATTSNGYLGASASINYTNRNLFRGGERLSISLSGGFESQPPIFDESVDGVKIKTASRSFNTFEVGPALKLTLPGLFPLRSSQISKKRRPQTIISTAYNYQNREDFQRGSFQLNYQWNFIITKTSLFEVGLPGVSVVKFINIKKSQEFEDRLNDLGDLFLINAYSNQFIWQDWRFRYEYNIKEKPNRSGNSQVYFSSVFDPAGNLLSAFKAFQDTVDNGQYAIAGVGYSQFARMDNELIFSKPLRKGRSFNMRFAVGGGLPYGNNKTSLPYDYSFYAGGANDNRGWAGRTLGPGGYKYYLDTLRSTTQIGDVRIGGFTEFRFSFNSFLKGAFFVDAGNIWTVDYDEKRPGGQLTKDWWRQIAVATGFGVRMDLDYFIIRLDLGFPIRNPALPFGENWIFQKKDAFIAESIATFGDPFYKSIVPNPFIPKFHFGIGYPF